MLAEGAVPMMENSIAITACDEGVSLIGCGDTLLEHVFRRENATPLGESHSLVLLNILFKAR